MVFRQELPFADRGISPSSISGVKFEPASSSRNTLSTSREQNR